MPTSSLAVARNVDRPLHGVRMPLAEFERLIEAKDIKPSIEWWDGCVEQKPMGKHAHGRSQSYFSFRFWPLLSSQRGATAGTEIHVWFEGRGWKVPDFAYWAPSKPRGTASRAMPPTLAIEILSPGQSLKDVRAKCRDMRALGTDICWLVDTARRVVEVFDRNADGAELAGDAVLSAPEIPELEIRLTDLWAAAGV